MADASEATEFADQKEIDVDGCIIARELDCRVRSPLICHRCEG